jgi:NAD-dependent DNA ligase
MPKSNSNDPYLEARKRQYIKAKTAYYNKRPILTDAAFDRLEDLIRKMDPDWAELKVTGTAVADKKTEVSLQELMPSLNKAYPEAVGKWVAKNPSDEYVVTDKLDGSSLQVVYNHGKLSQVVTRGNGILGGDITFLAPKLNLPWVIKSKSLTVFRCEAVIKREVFDRRWATEFDNPRNMVNGLLNRKTAHKALADVDIVVLGCYGLSVTAGLKLANMEGLHTVPLTGITKRQASPEGLTDLLETRLSKSLYDMDGLVVAPTDFKLVYRSADKPKGIVAFKVNADADAVQVTVESIIWQVSRTGRIIPKIRIADTIIGGVTVNHATAHNAKWMVDRKIGPGAVLKVVRSGGVIPKIVDVVKPTKKLSLPDVPYTQVGVHFEVAQDKADGKTKGKIKLEQLVKFLGTMGIEFLAAKTIAKLQPDLPTPHSYVKAWHEKWLAEVLLDVGIGSAMTPKIVAEFDRVFGSTVSMRQLMVASQCFGVGIGDRRLRQLEEAGISMRWLSQADEDEVDAKVSKIAGWSDKTVTLLISGLPKWQKFHDSVAEMLTINGSLPQRKKPSVNAGPLKGQRVSFTGYRDKAHEAAVEAAGGEIVPFGSKTTILLIKVGGKASTKVDKAREKGIRVCSFSDLKL